MHISLKKTNNFYYNIKQEYTESNTKALAPHFVSNQVVITHESYQRIYHTCSRVFGHQINYGKLDPSTLNHVEEYN